LFVDSIGLNVVTDKTIEFEKQVTIHTRNLRPEKALKVLCETNGLEYNVNDGVYYLSKQRWGEDNKGQVSPGLKMLSITVTKENKVTLEVNNADLDQVIRSIVLQSGINVIIYETISGAASAKVDSLPLDDVLRFLLQNTKYTFWRDKSIYFIGSREMSQQKTTVEVQCKYIMADEEEITKLLPPSITKEAVIKFDKEHNAVIIIGSFDIVAQAQEYFEKIDQPVPQVLIEALVVDFNISKTREYGLDLFIPDTFSQTVQHYFPYIQANVASKTIQHALNEIIKLIRPNDIITLPANFMGMMTVLEDADIAKVLSTPQIATLNGNTASIVIGETRYFKLEEKTSQLTQQTPVTISTDRFEKYQFDNKLEVTPWVMADRYVTVKIKPEFNIPRTKENTDIPPTADKRALESTVRLKDGQTIVLGGQRSTSETSSTQGIPFLASIPILGKLFSHEKTVKNETQMMIFLTPHVYYKDEAGINPQDYFKSKIEDLQTEKVIKNQKEKCKK